MNIVNDDCINGGKAKSIVDTGMDRVYITLYPVNIDPRSRFNYAGIV